MEYAILAGLAGLGFAVSKRGKEMRLETDEPAAPPETYAPVSVETRPTPHNHQRKAQSYNETLSQRKVELFTGLNATATSATGATFSKKEVRAAFPPPTGPITSGGTAARAVDYDADRAAAVNLVQYGYRNGVETGVRVGPGLGIDPMQTVSGDGFHPMYRAPTELVNQHRVHRSGYSLPKIVGTPAVPSERPVQGELTAEVLPKAFEVKGRVGYVPGKSVAVDAPSNFPQPYVKPTPGSRGTANEHIGLGRVATVPALEDRKATHDAGTGHRPDTQGDRRKWLPTPGIQGAQHPDNNPEILKHPKRVAGQPLAVPAGSRGNFPEAPRKALDFVLRGTDRNTGGVALKHAVGSKPGHARADTYTTYRFDRQRLAKPPVTAGAKEATGFTKVAAPRVREGSTAFDNRVPKGCGDQQGPVPGSFAAHSREAPQQGALADTRQTTYPALGQDTTNFNKLPSTNIRLFVR